MVEVGQELEKSRLQRAKTFSNFTSNNLKKERKYTQKVSEDSIKRERKLLQF